MCDLYHVSLSSSQEETIQFQVGNANYSPSMLEQVQVFTLKSTVFFIKTNERKVDGQLQDNKCFRETERFQRKTKLITHLITHIYKSRYVIVSSVDNYKFNINIKRNICDSTE